MQMDERTFQGHVNRLQKRHVFLAQKYVGPLYAEDAVQNALIKAWEHLPRFEGECSFDTWVHKIVVRESLNMRRDLTRKMGLGLESLVITSGGEERPREIASARPSQLDEAVAAEKSEKIQNIVDQLPLYQRQIVQLRYIEGHSGREAAETLGIPEATARSALWRATQALKINLSAEGLVF